MSPASMFDSGKDPLIDFLKYIQEGKIQLPDFQRGWVWDDIHIRELLASICAGYPIGAVMMLQTGNPDVKFKMRLVEGVENKSSVAPEWLILDGQQRLTSLFQAIYQGRPVRTRDHRRKELLRHYYIDMSKVLDPTIERFDAILSISEERRIENFRGETIEDYSSPDKEYEKGYFPFSQIFQCSGWRRGFNAYWKHDQGKTKLFDDFEDAVIKKFERYLLPVIRISNVAPKDAVCQVFERVNTGGVALNVFELMTATFAADDFNLRDDWHARETRLKERPALKGLESTDFLQSVSLLATLENKHKNPEAAVTCKKKDVLKITLGQYKKWADPLTAAYEEASKFLHTQGIYDGRDLPYRTQLVPLTAIFVALGDRGPQDSIQKKIARWFWSGVFGELYGGANETRFAKDLPEVLDWIDGKAEPSTVSEATFTSSRLVSLRTRNSAAYKGISALLMHDRCMDFVTGNPIDIQNYYDESVDIHHIFPSAYCESNGISPSRFNSVINKTPLAARTNRSIGGRAPSKYLDSLKRKYDLSDDRLAEILGSHVIDGNLLSRDNFDGFFAARKEALLDRIEKAIGKPVIRDDEKFDEGEDGEDVA